MCVCVWGGGVMGIWGFGGDKDMRCCHKVRDSISMECRNLNLKETLKGIFNSYYVKYTFL